MEINKNMHDKYKHTNAYMKDTEWEMDIVVYSSKCNTHNIIVHSSYVCDKVRERARGVGGASSLLFA